MLQTIPLGNEGGAGNLVIAEILVMHIDESILNADKQIDQTKFELVARLGGNWYTRVNEQSLFEVEKPNLNLGIGFDALPPSIRNSSILTGNDLAMLANVSVMPEIDPAFSDDKLKNIVQYFSVDPDDMEKELHRYAKELLHQQQTTKAWQVLLAGG